MTGRYNFNAKSAGILQLGVNLHRQNIFDYL